MAKSAAAERRDEKARALGFTSYGQQYRAGQRGYKGRGAEYNATLAVARGDKLARVPMAGGGLVIAGQLHTAGEARAFTRAVIKEARKRHKRKQETYGGGRRRQWGTRGSA